MHIYICNINIDIYCIYTYTYMYIYKNTHPVGVNQQETAIGLLVENNVIGQPIPSTNLFHDKRGQV